MLDGQGLGSVGLGERAATPAAAGALVLHHDSFPIGYYSPHVVRAVDDWLAAWATGLLEISAADTVAPGVVDSAAIAVVVITSDTLAPGITDAVSDFAALLAVADTLGTGITDTTAEIFATLAAADALDVRIVDAAALLAALSASDTVAPGIADTAAVLAQLSAGDTVAVSISDGALVDILASTLGHMVAIITVRPSIGAAAPDVKPALGGKPTLH